MGPGGGVESWVSFSMFCDIERFSRRALSLADLSPLSGMRPVPLTVVPYKVRTFMQLRASHFVSRAPSCSSDIYEREGRGVMRADELVLVRVSRAWAMMGYVTTQWYHTVGCREVNVLGPSHDPRVRPINPYLICFSDRSGAQP